MNKKLTLIAASAAILVSAAACSQKQDNENASVASVNELDVEVALLDAAQSYEIIMNRDTMHLVMTANIQWPKMVGSHDMTPLQDSIMAFAFPEYHDISIKEAMIRYVGNTEATGIPSTGASVTPTSEAFSESEFSYNSTITGRVLEFSDRMITYQITESAYLGGAHPNTTSRSITYDFANSTLLSPANVIKSESLADFTAIAKRNLAAQLNMTETELDQALMVEKFALSNDLYIADRAIYIHYNPYEILPYSVGTVDVMVSPYEVRDMLTPKAENLLINQ